MLELENARRLGIKKKKQDQTNQENYKDLPPNTGNSICTAEVHDGVAGGKNWLALPCTVRTPPKRRGNILRKNINHTPTQPLMTNPTNAFFRDRNVARARPTTTDPIAKSKLCLNLHIPRLTKLSHNASLVEHRIGRAHASLEVEFQFAHFQFGWD